MFPAMFPKILVFAGSTRTGSYNARLAARAAKEFALAGADVTWISLHDYPLPLYDGDQEANSGIPDNARKLKQMIMAHQGVFIVSPEYNASIPPLLKNALDWISRVRERNEPPLAAYHDRIFALGSASERASGGIYVLLALRQVLETGCGALVLPEQIAVSHANEAFDENDNLIDVRHAEQFQLVVTRLVDTAQEFARVTA
jgi:chromate reductase, NAD(P)H dehydrogenase (quinone)